MAQSTPLDRTRRTQAQRRDESEQKLLRAAGDVIAERGVTAATFEAIGAQAGYSRGLATQKFGSKQGMIEALRGGEGGVSDRQCHPHAQAGPV